MRMRGHARVVGEISGSRWDERCRRGVLVWMVHCPASRVPCVDLEDAVCQVCTKSVPKVLNPCSPVF